MGLILECYAVDANQVTALDPSGNDIELVRTMGIAVGSVSINAQAPETALKWIAGSLLQALDLEENHPSGALVRHGDLDGLVAYMQGVNMSDQDIVNGIVDAAQAAKWRNLALWVGVA